LLLRGALIQIKDSTDVRFGSLADIPAYSPDVRFTPIADIAKRDCHVQKRLCAGATNGTLLNYLVAHLLTLQRHVEALIARPLMDDVVGASSPRSPMSVRPVEGQVQSNQPNREIP
jgi:hypothetical protein